MLLEVGPKAQAEKKLDQNSAYLATESGQQMFVCNWCYKRIVNGAGDNVWSKFQTACSLMKSKKTWSSRRPLKFWVRREKVRNRPSPETADPMSLLPGTHGRPAGKGRVPGMPHLQAQSLPRPHDYPAGPNEPETEAQADRRGYEIRPGERKHPSSKLQKMGHGL